MIRIPVIAVACFAMFANDQAGALLALVTVGHRWGLILRQVVGACEIELAVSG